MKIIKSQSFNFTYFVSSKEPFEILKENFETMRIDRSEILESIFNENQNSPHGIFGLYRTRLGKPDVVIADEESLVGKGKYYYKIKVYLLNPEVEDAYNDVITVIKNLMKETEGV